MTTPQIPSPRRPRDDRGEAFVADGPSASGRGGRTPLGSSATPRKVTGQGTCFVIIEGRCSRSAADTDWRLARSDTIRHWPRHHGDAPIAENMTGRAVQAHRHPLAHAPIRVQTWQPILRNISDFGGLMN